MTVSIQFFRNYPECSVWYYVTRIDKTEIDVILGWGVEDYKVFQIKDISSLMIT